MRAVLRPALIAIGLAGRALAGQPRVHAALERLRAAKRKGIRLDREN
jgi:hypothetical protein